MPKLSLQCAIVGVKGSAFPIDIDENLSVGHLKEAIKETKPLTITCEADHLQLFLAKQPVEEEGGKEIVPVYSPSAKEMKEESLMWLPDEHRAALKLVKGESDDYINTLTAGEQIMALNTLATWFYEKNNMEFPSSEQIHVLVVVPERAGGDQKRSSMLLDDRLARFEENTVRMWQNVVRENREWDRKLTERFTKLERALNLATPSKSDSQWGQDQLKLLLKFGCVSDADKTVGADAFWSVKVQTQVDCIETEDVFDAFITPYFNNVLNNLDVVFVNSKSYEWLSQSTHGNSTRDLKPNGFVTHRGMYHKEPEPNDDVSRVGTSFRFGKAVKALFDCLTLFESKITIDLGGAPFGQIMRYIQHVFPKGPGSAVLFNRTTFWLINSINGGVVRVIKATWVMEGSKALFRDFITKNLSPWVKRLTAACSSLNVEVVEGDAFLGSGAFGRVFKVKQVGEDEDMLALKIVETSVFPEIGALVHAEQTDLAVRFVAIATNISDGAAMLLSPVGEPISFPTTREEVRALFDMLWQLHSAGVAHGDPRVPNVIVKDEQRLWIDLVESRDASPILMQNDAKILTQSILHVFPKDSLGLELETLIKNYGANPTQPNLDALAVKVGETLAEC